MLEWVRIGSIDRFDALVPEQLIETASAGALELHTWAAAAAAYHRDSGAAPIETFYAPTVEYGIGYGMAYGAA